MAHTLKPKVNAIRPIHKTFGLPIGCQEVSSFFESVMSVPC